MVVRRAFIGVLLASAAVLPALLSGASLAAPPISATCSATIYQYATTISVVSSPTEPAFAHAIASVLVSKPPLVQVRVTLTAGTDIGWPVDVSPASEVVTDSDTGQLSVDVRVTVPPGTPAGSRAVVTLSAAADAGRYPCDGDSSSALEVLSAPLVDSFEGHIVADSLVVSDNARHVDFQVAFEALANTPIHVTLEYLVEPGAEVQGPSSVDLNPQQGGWDNATINITLLGRGLSSGHHNFSMRVVGEAEGYPPLEGDLGFAYYIPSSREQPPSPPLVQFSSWVELAILVAAAAVTLAVGAPLIALHRVRQKRLERQVARLRYRRRA